MYNDLMNFLSHRSGLRLSEQDQQSVRKKIGARMKHLGISALADYKEFIEEKSPEAEKEWSELFDLLTNGESYFFRDPDQFALLRNEILPEILGRRKEQPLLRIWSAGCSAGEEPYSLALILNDLIPRWDEWNVTILGTDINVKAIERARAGKFSPWSLRRIPQDMKERYFTEVKGSWILDERIRRRVTFVTANLLEKLPPAVCPEAHDFDLIICRNVFIYLHETAHRAVVGNFAETLNADGYLMTGHGEILSGQLGKLRPRIIGGQVVFQKEAARLCRDPLISLPAKPAAANPPIVAPKGGQGDAGRALAAKNHPRKEVGFNPPVADQTDLSPDGVEKGRVQDQSVVAEMKADLDHGRFPAVIKNGKRLIKMNPDHFEAYVLMAEAFSNSGDMENATSMCLKARAIDPGSPRPLFLQALLMEGNGQTQEAKNFLKKVMYVAPDFVAAYLELGKLYAMEKDDKNARKMYIAAKDLLKDLPLENPIIPFNGVCAGELILHVETLLREMSHGS